jgi:hypothetical protein
MTGSSLMVSFFLYNIQIDYLVETLSLFNQTAILRFLRICKNTLLKANKQNLIDFKKAINNCNSHYYT